MSEPKPPWTPGPWHVGVGGILHANRVWTADMKPVAGLLSFGTSPADLDPTAQANGRLIAAAPTTYQQLEKLVLAAEAALVTETERAYLRHEVEKARALLQEIHRG